LVGGLGNDVIQVTLGADLPAGRCDTLLGDGGLDALVLTVEAAQAADPDVQAGLQALAAFIAAIPPGAPGDATARLAESEIVPGDNAQDIVRISMWAKSAPPVGIGGGLPAVPSAPPGASYTDPGSPAVPDLVVAFPTVATIEITGNRIELGGGAFDELSFTRGRQRPHGLHRLPCGHRL
jgi:hypothetical protein